MSKFSINSKVKKVFCFSLSVLFLCFSIIINAQNVWNQKAAFPSTARAGAFSFSAHGKGYSGAGLNYATLSVSDVWEFNGVTNTWTQKADFPEALYSASSFVIHDTAYVTCGWYNTTGVTNIHTYFYDDINNTWHQVADYPGTPVYNAVGFALKGKGYVGIGYAPYNNELWEYSPANNSWVQKTSFPGAMRMNCVNFALNNKGYVGGGAYEPTLTVFNDFYEYDPDSDSWTPIGNIPGIGRYGASSFVFGENEEAYMACGYDYVNYLNDVWRFDPFGYNWEKVADYPGLARIAATEFAINNVGYIGLGIGGTYQTDMWEYTPGGPNLLYGNFFTDDNNNQVCDSAEAPMKNIIVEVNPGNLIFGTDNAGIFKGFAGTGNYTVTVPNPPLYYSMLPVSNSIFFGGNGLIDSTSNFAFAPTAGIQDLRMELTPLTGPKPGHQHYYNVWYQNVGTTIQSGNVQVVFDSKLQYNGSIPIDSTISVSSDTLSFSYSDLEPQESRVIMLIFDVDNSAVVGDTIYTTAILNPVTGDNTIADNTDSKVQPVVASYDPNDISVEPSGSITPQQVSNGQWLTYTIRFQNTGTASADNVWVTDTIEPNLDLTSFEILSSSHNYSFSLKGNRALRFAFKNINLPDSNANEPLSHGFIKFRIKPLSTLTVGSSISNLASIFFDFNAPVITNTVVTNVLNPNGIIENNMNTSSVLYPNPASNTLSFMNNNLHPYDELKLFSVEGKLIRVYHLNQGENNFDIKFLSAGVYNCEIISSDLIKHQKFVVKK